MVKEIDISVLRRALGIKKLKKKISVTAFEKAVVENLRERELHRLAARIRQHA